MGMVRSSVRGFTKGLVSDAVGVDNALLQAFDVYLDRAGELRWRGPKDQVTPALVAGIGLDGLAYSVAKTRAFNAHPALGQVAVTSPGDVPAGSFTEVIVKRPQDVAWTAVGRRHVLPFGGGGTLDTTFADRVVFGFDRALLIAQFSTIRVPLALGAPAPITMWGGSTKDGYAVGTVTTVAGSTTITGAGTAWLAEVDVGSWFRINAGATDVQFTRVIAVDSNVSLRVAEPMITGAAGRAYNIVPLAALAGSAAAWGGLLTPFAAAAGVHQGRLFLGAIDSSGSYGLNAHRLVWSALPGERDPASTNFIGIQHYNTNAFIDIDPTTGTQITGLASYGGVLLILKDTGVFVLTGGVATDGSDQGQSVQRISDQVGCPSVQGYDTAEDGVYFADARGAYRFNSKGITPLTSQRIEKEWRANMTGVMTVSALRDRVVFQAGPNRDQIYVWDVRHEVWLRQRVPFAYSHLARVFDSTGTQVGEHGVRREWDGAGDLEIHNWQTDNQPASILGTGNDANSTTTPRADVTTHPLPTSRVKGGRGRPLRVFVEAFAELFVLPTIPQINLSVTLGNRLSGEPGDGPTIALDSITPADSSKVAKRRIVASENAAGVIARMTQADDDAADGAFYAVTLESAETGRHAG